jgi:hypothetical protein
VYLLHNRIGRLDWIIGVEWSMGYGGRIWILHFQFRGIRLRIDQMILELFLSWAVMMMMMEVNEVVEQWNE